LTALSLLSLHDALPIYNNRLDIGCLQFADHLSLDRQARGDSGIEAPVIGSRLAVTEEVGQVVIFQEEVVAGCATVDPSALRQLRSEEHTSELQSPDHLV